MDPSDVRPSPRRELALQGPRPSPLKVTKQSHTIKKPPIAPPPQPHRPNNLRPPSSNLDLQPQPLIIYSVSPKIIHTNTTNFMTLVQRLTGPHSTPDTSVADLSLPSPAGGALSPAARIATFERSSPSPTPPPQFLLDDFVAGGELFVDAGFPSERPAASAGILSPMPSSLPPISPALFSSGFDLGFLGDAGGVGFWEGGSLVQSSPGNSFLMTPLLTSPGASWGDLFGQFLDP